MTVTGILVIIIAALFVTSVCAIVICVTLWKQYFKLVRELQEALKKVPEPEYKPIDY